MKLLFSALLFFPVIGWGFDASIEVFTDYRVDDFSFSVSSLEEILGVNSFASFDEDLRVIGADQLDDGLRLNSIGKYSDLRIWEVGGRANVGLCDVFVAFEGKYGWIDGGRFDLSEKFAETGEILTSIKAKNVDGNNYDLTGALGYRFFLCDCAFTISPEIGYSYYSNQYKFSSTNNTLTPENAENVQPLKVNYKNNFKGPWVGFDTHYFATDCFKVFGIFRYEWLRHAANINGALSFMFNDLEGLGFLKIHHKINSWGPLFRVGADYYFCNCLFLGALFQYRYIQGDHGKENIDNSSMIIQNGTVVFEDITIQQNDLNKVQWNSWLVELHLGFYF